ncbi:hypothetical protein [Chryseobacterium sp. RR2-3-20]|uniref:hypothetical protein n=1 Tax=Chryseobacterium sp. RR2-3-20 TaxID=2787626 RepID=UPI001AE062A2|nr:hypothetical protein [Chryseobacterium sp. RR2-3-20]
MLHKSNLLIVNPLFTELFIKNSKEILKDEYIVDEFFIKRTRREYRLLKLFHKICNLFYIHILKKRDYYKKVETTIQNNYYKRCLDKIKNNKYEKILFCRGDRLPAHVLARLRVLGNELINYQCDGVKMCPDIFDKKKYFSSIYSFEKDDISLYPELELIFIPNFYFEHYRETKEVVYDLYYIGIGLNERIKILENLAHLLPQQRIHFMVSGQEKENSSALIFFSDYISYEENLSNVMKSKCIIDLKMDVHNGLSFRFFEAMYYEKKIITNNTDVKNYNFYHPDNILVVDYKSIDTVEVSNFLNRDYYKIDNDIIQDYSFKVWLRKILEISSN